MKLPQVSIILLNWNQEEITLDCLNSLMKLDYLNYKVILVDNSSFNNSVKKIKQMFPEITLIQNRENLGFTEGNNVGISYGINNGSDYILLLNNDTIVDKNFLKELALVAEKDSTTGIVGPKIYFYDEPKKIWFAGGKINWQEGIKYHIGAYEIDHGQYDKIREVDYITGCALLIKREVIEKIGLLDSRYFIYFEETDWNLRAKKAGYKILYVPEARIWHKISLAMGSGTPLSTYYYTRNRLLFFSENGPRKKQAFYLLYYTLSTVKSSIATFLKRRYEISFAYLKGLFDFYLGRFGKQWE